MSVGLMPFWLALPGWQPAGSSTPVFRCLQQLCAIFRMISGSVLPASSASRGREDSACRFRGWRITGAVWVAIAVLPGLFISADAGAEAGADAPLPARLLLLDGAIAGSRIIVVGERGHILVSSDDGANWKRARVPTRVMLTAIYMHDAETGWAVGHDAVILRTADGGETWTKVHEAPEEELPLLDVWFRDGQRGLAVGAYGYALATGDGGETWTPHAISEDDFHLNALVPASDLETGSERLYIAAEAGVIYRSDDGGETWRELPSPYAGSWFGGLVLDENQVLLAGLRGHLFRSENGGDSWTEIPTGTQATLTGAIRLPSGVIVVTGLEGSVLTSRDDGRNVSSRNLQTREGISTSLPLSDGATLLIGEFGTVRLALGE